MLAELRLVRVVAWSMLLWSGKWVRGTVLGDGRATCVRDLWAPSIPSVDGHRNLPAGGHQVGTVAVTEGERLLGPTAWGVVRSPQTPNPEPTSWPIRYGRAVCAYCISCRQSVGRPR
jgi:hypothetical protein